MAREMSPSSNEDWAQWEIVDVQAQSKQVDSPPMAATAPQHLGRSAVQSQLLCNNDEEKASILRERSTSGDNEDDDVFDLQALYRQQQEQLQQAQEKHQQLTQSVLMTQNNLMSYQNDGKARQSMDKFKQQEYEGIITENQKTLQKLETQKRDAQAIVEELLQANEDLKKRLDELCRQREYDKQCQLRREEEYIKELERNKDRQVKSEVEKELIKKEKELVSKEKELIRLEKEELLQLQRRQEQEKKRQELEREKQEKEKQEKEKREKQEKDRQEKEKKEKQEKEKKEKQEKEKKEKQEKEKQEQEKRRIEQEKQKEEEKKRRLKEEEEKKRKEVEEKKRKEEEEKKRRLKEEQRLQEEQEKRRLQEEQEKRLLELRLIEKKLREEEEKQKEKEKEKEKQNLSKNNNEAENKDWSDSEFEMLWKCRVCGRENDESVRSCKSCDQRQHYDRNNSELLTVKCLVNAGTWKPCEEREYGWTLQNNSTMPLKFKTKLVHSSGKILEICEEGTLLSYETKTNGHLVVIVHTRAPAICGQYCATWKMMTHDDRQIGPELEMKLVVKSELKNEQEQKVRQMLSELGFIDRDAVVVALTLNNWDMERAAQYLFDTK